MASSSLAPPPPSARPPPWVELPAEITVAILHKVGTIEMLTTTARVCKTWRNICNDPATWRVIDMRGGDILRQDYNLEKMCRHAVDRSQGQLLDVNLEIIASDELLLYIAQRSSQLRRLQIVRGNVTGKGLSQAVMKFPLLEELNLYYTSVDAESIKAIGSSCPLLHSFKLNNQGYTYPHVECDEEALAVAASIPNLRHLQLFGNKMTNGGLTAILDGCPRLESLDLRQCFNVSLGGNLGGRCSQQLKDLRAPDDSTEDYPFDSSLRDPWDDLYHGDCGFTESYNYFAQIFMDY